MSTEQTLQIESTSSDDTYKIAAKIGAKFRGGEVFILDADLGSGKTTFVKGLAQGFGSSEIVTSPSFTISNVYQNDKSEKQLVHFDFYRLEDPGVVKLELSEYIDNPDYVLVIEWGEIIEDILLDDTIRMLVEVVSEQERKLTFKYLPSRQYLFDGLVQ